MTTLRPHSWSLGKHGAASAPSHPSTVDAITGLRGYAALWVVFSHVLYTDSLSAPLGERAQWVSVSGLVRHEHLAVDLFFVLSGFVLTHVHAREMDAGFTHRSYVRFLLLRLARVYPLHLFAMIAAAAMYQIVPNGLANTVGSFILQVFMMASWGFSSGVSWNAPAWSLSSEWLAYLVLPLMILVSAGLGRMRSQLVALGLLIVLVGFLFYGFLLSPHLLFWLDISNGTGASARVLSGVAIGCVLRRLYDQPKVRRLPWSALFWLSLPIAAATMTDLGGRRLDNSLWSFMAIVFVVFAAACASPRRLSLFTSRVPMYLGEISYAMYIFHFPVVTALGWLARTQLKELATQGSVLETRLVVLGSILVVVVVAALANELIEKPIRQRARRWIDRSYPIDLSPSVPSAEREEDEEKSGRMMPTKQAG